MDTTLDKAEHAVKAQAIWDGMDKNERTAVRFGMFPAAKMEAASKEGYDGRLMAVALMNCAEKNGGMRA